MTDERILTPQERLTKIERRFVFFRDLTIEASVAWIHPKLFDQRSREDFEKICGYIATIVSVANAYTFQFRRSRSLALNAGLLTGSGELTAFLDPGDYSLSCFLKQAAACHLAAPKILILR